MKALLAVIALVCIQQVVGVKFILLAPQSYTRNEPYNVSLLLQATSNDSSSLTTCSLVISLLSCYSDNTVASVSQIVKLNQQTPVSLPLPKSGSSNADSDDSFRVKIESANCADVNATATSWQTGCASNAGPLFAIYIQTDKKMYKPGQTVKMRVFALHNANLTAISHLPFKIEIFDAQANKIQEWRDERSTSGVISKSLPISSRPVLGDWRIRATLNGVTREATVTVAEYVLPTFEVKLSYPIPYYVRSRDTFTVEVQAVYTYGKPVIGRGTIEISARPPTYYFWQPRPTNEPTPSVTALFTTTAEQPTARLTFKRAQIESLITNDTYGNVLSLDEISIVAKFTEDATGVLRNTTGSVKVYDSAFKLAVIDGATPSAFRPDFPYLLVMEVTKQDGSQLSEDELQQLSVRTTFKCVTNRYSAKRLASSYATDEVTIESGDKIIDSSGLVLANVTAPANCSAIALSANLSSRTGNEPLPGELTRYIQKFGTSGNVVLKVGLSDAQPASGSWLVGDTVNIKATMINAAVQALYITVVARGRTVFQESVRSVTALPSEERLRIKLTAAMTPKCVVLVWTVADGELIADNLELSVEGAIGNVSLAFDAAEKRVGETAQLSIRSEAQSFVAVLAVDKSALLQASNDNEVRRSALLKQALCTDDSCSNTVDSIITPYVGMRPFGFCVPWFMFDGQSTKELFNKAGLLLLTNYLLYSTNYGPRARMSNNGPEMVFMAAAQPDVLDDDSMPTGGAQATANVKIRRSFPETWLWLDIDSNSNSDGYVNVTKPVADSITTWITTAFALHPTRGIGVADAAELRVFNPFFINIQLPYSVVRGEQFDLKVVVFNYAVDSETVRVSLEKSDDFAVATENELESSKQTVSESVTVRRDVPYTVTFRVTPNRIGTIKVKAIGIGQSSGLSDGIEREVVVIAEGIPQVQTVALLVTLSDSKQWTSTVPIVLPQQVVEGSLRVGVSVFGDFLGSTVNGIDKLLRMPYGCGEQNMLNFAPNIYITRYLTASGMLTDAIKEKAQTYMITGYQRELTYKRDDSSFSAFGQQDAAGSLWLSAFVVRCFWQAKAFMYIDEAVLNATTAWIFKQFDSSKNTFADPGRVLHAEMQGGSARGVALNAYTLIALLEDATSRSMVLSDTYRSGVVREVVKQLEQTAVESLSNYELSIVLYALTLYGQSDFVGTVASRLESQKRAVGDMAYWPAASSSEQTGAGAGASSVSPIEIETAAYMLLRQVRIKKIVEGVSVLRWLVSKRNSEGGFMSTQDTVVGLQALSEFAAQYFTPEGLNVDLKVTAGESFTESVSVNAGNRLLVQTVEVPSVSSLVFTASGSGMIFVQTTWEYTIKSANTTLDGPVRIEASSKFMDGGRSLMLRFCSSWNGRTPSGMFLSEANLPSGFSLDSSTEELRSQFNDKKFALKMVEQNGDRTVSLYFDDLPIGEQVCTVIRARESMKVVNRQPALLRSMPYYEPQKQRSMLYSAGDGKDLPTNFFDNSAATGVRWSWVFLVSQLLTAYICVLLGCIVYT